MPRQEGQSQGDTPWHVLKRQSGILSSLLTFSSRVWNCFYSVALKISSLLLNNFYCPSPPQNFWCLCRNIKQFLICLSTQSSNTMTIISQSFLGLNEKPSCCVSYIPNLFSNPWERLDERDMIFFLAICVCYQLPLFDHFTVVSFTSLSAAGPSVFFYTR